MCKWGGKRSRNQIGLVKDKWIEGCYSFAAAAATSITSMIITNPPDSYRIENRTISGLTDKELALCVELLKCGAAVDPFYAVQELPLAKARVIAALDDTIIGIGAIKRAILAGKGCFVARIDICHGNRPTLNSDLTMTYVWRVLHASYTCCMATFMSG